ncbi:CAP domain-containing protein [Halolamina salifodinae]|uniref:Uncharacterized protein YkwD n=1 Tax=Halolamina salifodinae TaxID=1202767 RepID=A0A8T4GZ49_9EURY|nr:CAP domain-containing protein [Halolamina salifodinae]MBP1987413.1 uncharacterized protein YkwD [Halolamina salifodinae]
MMRLPAIVVCLLLLSAGCASVSGPTHTPTDENGATETANTPAHPTTPSPDRFYVDVERIEKLIHEKMNKHRVENGLEPLTRNESLDAVARYKSWDMAQRDYFDHDGPNGTLHSDLRDRYGTTCDEIGQNIYKDKNPKLSSDPQSELMNTENISEGAVSLILNSSGHRQNALSPNYDSQGIGVFVDENGSVYVTQELCG